MKPMTLKQSIFRAASCAAFLATTLTITSCGGGGGGGNNSAKTVRPKTMEGIQLALADGTTMRFFADPATTDASATGTKETGIVLVASPASTVLPFKDLRNRLVPVSSLDAVSSATYEYVGTSGEAGEIKIKGRGSRWGVDTIASYNRYIWEFASLGATNNGPIIVDEQGNPVLGPDGQPLRSSTEWPYLFNARLNTWRYMPKLLFDENVGTINGGVGSGGDLTKDTFFNISFVYAPNAGTLSPTFMQVGISYNNRTIAPEATTLQLGTMTFTDGVTPVPANYYKKKPDFRPSLVAPITLDTATFNFAREVVAGSPMRDFTLSFAKEKVTTESGQVARKIVETGSAVLTIRGSLDENGQQTTERGLKYKWTRINGTNDAELELSQIPNSPAYEGLYTFKFSGVYSASWTKAQTPDGLPFAGLVNIVYGNRTPTYNTGDGSGNDGALPIQLP